jgi:hypothetical protein
MVDVAPMVQTPRAGAIPPRALFPLSGLPPAPAAGFRIKANLEITNSGPILRARILIS